MLMAVPRNLVYVFACVIVFAFLCMVYIVYSEKNLASFMTASNQVNENLVIHPIFDHFRKVLTSVDQIPQLSLLEMTPKRFYQEFLTNNVPAVVSDGCRTWPAVDKWQRKAYLEEEFGG